MKWLALAALDLLVALVGALLPRDHVAAVTARRLGTEADARPVAPDVALGGTRGP